MFEGILERQKFGLTNVTDKIIGLLDEFNNTIPMIQALGVSVSNLNMDMSPVPLIQAKLTGKFEDIDSDQIEQMIQDKGDKKMLITILKALQLASKAKDQLSAMNIKGVELGIKIGVAPEITIGFTE